MAGFSARKDSILKYRPRPLASKLLPDMYSVQPPSLIVHRVRDHRPAELEGRIGICAMPLQLFPIPSPSIPLPNTLLDTWYISRLRKHSEIELLEHGQQCAHHVKEPSSMARTYSRHLEVAQNTSTLPSYYTSVANLGRSCVAVHLTQLELCLGASSCWQTQISNDISQGLSMVVFSKRQARR